MRYFRRCARLLLMLQLLLQVCQRSRCSNDLMDQVGVGDLGDAVQEEDSRKQQQGSWLHWWSYDGISGPDYWNINKRWQVCSWGRKQSPVELRTDRLVYDHLLTPLKLTWITPDLNLQTSANSLSTTTTTTTTTSNNPHQQQQHQQHQEQQAQENTNTEQLDNQNRLVKVQLLNSGRGIEAWLEGHVGLGGGFGLSWLKHQDQLVLSHGPLSYAYKLFKIELHSASSYSSRNNRLPQSAALTEDVPSSNAHLRNGDADVDNNQNNAASQDEYYGSASQDEESVPEALKSGKSSEHLIDGRAFDGELQLHFYNKHFASSTTQALKMADEGVRASLFATISVFILTRNSRQQPGARKDESDNQTTNNIRANSSAIDFFLDNLVAIQDQGNSIELQLTRRHIVSLVPDLAQYITYQGSLTRPPCTESVDWILINRALRVDEEKFTGLFEKLNTNQDNIRPIKALYRRQLRTTINNLSYGQPKQRYAFGHQESRTKTDPTLQQQQQQTDLNCFTADEQSLSSSGAGRRNCTIKHPMETGETKGTQANSYNNGQPGKEKHHTTGQCSMKPQYTYQLSYKQEL